MESKVINRIKAYKVPEQVLLLCSREHLEIDEQMYIEEIIKSPDMDWSWLLGNALYHRVCGKVYNNIKNLNGIPWRVMFFFQAVYEKMVQRNILHQNELAKINNIFEENNIHFAFLKGAVLNTIYYEEGERISSDTDIISRCKRFR